MIALIIIHKIDTEFSFSSEIKDFIDFLERNVRFLWAMGFGIRFLVKPSQLAIIVGWICLVFSLSVVIARFCIVRPVTRTKSVEYMPFLLSLFLTLSAVMLFFYGLLIKDYNVAVPNVLGFIFGVLQMLLYVKYKNADRINTKQNLPAEIQQVVVSEDPKIPEQIINIVELGEVLNSENIAVASHMNVDGVEASQNQNLPQAA